MLGRNGVRNPAHCDIWTALMTGLVDQQIANDPGGDRWSRLVDEVVAMFLAHCAMSEFNATSERRESSRQPKAWEFPCLASPSPACTIWRSPSPTWTPASPGTGPSSTSTRCWMYPHPGGVGRSSPATTSNS